MKELIVMIALLGMFCFALVVMTATPTDREQYSKCIERKEKK